MVISYKRAEHEPGLNTLSEFVNVACGNGCDIHLAKTTDPDDKIKLHGYSCLATVYSKSQAFAHRSVAFSPLTYLNIFSSFPFFCQPPPSHPLSIFSHPLPRSKHITRDVFHRASDCALSLCSRGWRLCDWAVLSCRKRRFAGSSVGAYHPE
jgi:hypothetical protein